MTNGTPIGVIREISNKRTGKRRNGSGLELLVCFFILQLAQVTAGERMGRYCLWRRQGAHFRQVFDFYAFPKGAS